MRPSRRAAPCWPIFRDQAAIHPILALPEKRPLAWEPRWSASPGCYQLKSAMAWHELFEVTGESAFQRGYESALEAALENDREFLPGDSDPQRVMDRLHAYAYFLEGLLPVLDRPECAAAFRNGVDRAARYLREIAPVFARSDVYAQLLRVRLLGELTCRSIEPRPGMKPNRRPAFKSSHLAADSCSAASKAKICRSSIRFRPRFACKRSRCGTTG